MAGFELTKQFWLCSSLGGSGVRGVFCIGSQTPPFGGALAECSRLVPWCISISRIAPRAGKLYRIFGPYEYPSPEKSGAGFLN